MVNVAPLIASKLAQTKSTQMLWMLWLWLRRSETVNTRSLYLIAPVLIWWSAYTEICMVVNVIKHQSGTPPSWDNLLKSRIASKLHYSLGYRRRIQRNVDGEFFLSTLVAVYQDYRQYFTCQLCHQVKITCQSLFPFLSRHRKWG